MRLGHCLFVFILALALPALAQSPNVFPPTGSVGIGTNTPSGVPLHIIRSSGGKSAVTLVQLEFDGFASWYMSLGRDDSDKSTWFLSTGGTNPLALREDGQLTLNSLRGSDTRMLVADSNGAIHTQALPKEDSGSGDNLGNHKATTNLDLQSRDIVSVSRLFFDGQPTLYQTSASPWVYYNLPAGYRADARFLIGMGNIDPSYKLKVEGDAYATGLWIASDSRLKSGLTPIGDAIRKLRRVRGVSYDFSPDPATPPYRSAGLIAQEVNEVLPEAVRKDANGQLAINYAAAVALLVEAVKEQQATIGAQQRTIAQLERRVSALEGSTRE